MGYSVGRELMMKTHRMNGVSVCMGHGRFAVFSSANYGEGREKKGGKWAAGQKNWPRRTDREAKTPENTNDVMIPEVKCC